MNKPDLLAELERLYRRDLRFSMFLEELGRVIVNKKGNTPFSEIYETIVYKYMFDKEKADE